MSTDLCLAANRSCLEQALDLLDRIGDERYARRRGEWSPVGAQYRHVVEHYQCLLDGVGQGRVDYDARRRDAGLERSVLEARGATADIHARLGQLVALPPTLPISVQMKSRSDDSAPEWTGSTLGRELQFLLSHTIHHFALIKLLLAEDRIALPPEFGVAPSTLAHARSQA